jgi:hypothetical protein
MAAETRQSFEDTSGIKPRPAPEKSFYDGLVTFAAMLPFHIAAPAVAAILGPRAAFPKLSFWLTRPFYRFISGCYPSAQICAPAL